MTATLTRDTMHSAWIAGYKAACEGKTLAELIVRWQNDPRNMRFSVEQWQAILDGFNRIGANEINSL